jgi:CRP-like cAMP-binding protein
VSIDPQTSAYLSDPLTTKLQQGIALSDEDRQALASLLCRKRFIDARVNLAVEEREPNNVWIILSGFACRSRTLRDGGRSITALLIAGDLTNLHFSMRMPMREAVWSLSRCTVVETSATELEAIFGRSPAMGFALRRAQFLESSITNAWLVNMGRQSADQQLGHLLCELYVRMKAVGMAGGSDFPFPLTQFDLADMLGISAVHTNRVLQQLRRQGLVDIVGRVATIKEPDRLAAFAEFDAEYLHLNGASGDHRPA